MSLMGWCRMGCFWVRMGRFSFLLEVVGEKANVGQVYAMGC